MTAPPGTLSTLPPPTAAALWGDAAAARLNASAELHNHDVRHRMFVARRTGLRNRIRDDLRVSEQLADLIVAEWEEEAMRRGLAPLDRPYWSEAGRWVTDRFMHQPLD